VAFLTIDAQVGFDGGGGEAARGGSTTFFFVCDVLESLNKLLFLHYYFSIIGQEMREMRGERRER
jgi:hypothetical protein